MLTYNYIYQCMNKFSCFILHLFDALIKLVFGSYKTSSVDYDVWPASAFNQSHNYANSTRPRLFRELEAYVVTELELINPGPGPNYNRLCIFKECFSMLNLLHSISNVELIFDFEL